MNILLIRFHLNCHPEAKDLLCLRHFILFFVLVRFDEKEILACFFGLLVTKYPDIFEEKNQVFKINKWRFHNHVV